MKNLFTTIFVVLSIISFSQTGDGSWSTKAPIPTARKEIANSTVSLNGKIYVIGGVESNGTISNKVEVYEVASDSWSEVANLPIRVWRSSATALEGKIYVLGGYTSTAAFPFSPTDKVYEYDPLTDTWVEKSSLPSARGSLAAVTLNKRIHVLGGASSNALRIHQIYEPISDTWENSTSITGGRSGLSAVSYENKIYIMGGYFLQNGVVQQNDLFVYDPGTEDWSQLADMPANRVGIDVEVINNKIYVFGGEPSSPVSKLMEYNINSDTWTELTDMPTPVSFMGVAEVDGLLYAIGGGPVNLNRFDAVDLNRVYDPGMVTDVEEIDEVRKVFSLEQNYPNPFNPSTTIKFTIPSVGDVIRLGGASLTVLLKTYDILGNEITTLVNENKPPGIYEIEFDAANLTSGVYFYRLEVGSFTQIKKMMLLK